MALSLMILFVAKNLMRAQNILCVDRDGSTGNPENFTDVWQFYQPVFDELGYDYDYYEVVDLEEDGPGWETMMNYSMVFWFTGEVWSGSGTMTINDDASLQQYLLAFDGKLLLSAQDYLWDRYQDCGVIPQNELPYYALGVTEVAQDVWQIEPPEAHDSANIVGSTGSYAEGLAFTVLDIFTEEVDDGLYIDQIIDHQGEDLMDVILPDPEGVSAIQFDAGTHKAIFSTVSLASIVDPEDRKEFIFRSIGWLHGTTGVAALKMEQTDVIIHPNPASEYIQIGCRYEMDEVWIMNSTGQVVDHFNVGHDRTKINTSDYSTGVYFVKVKTDNGTQTSRIIVE